MKTISTPQTLRPRNIEFDHLQNKFFQKLTSKGRSSNTIKNYRTDLECFNQFLQKNQNKTNFNQINIPYLEQYGHYLENRYSSHNSRRRRVQTLRIFFDFLVEENIFSSNPVRKLPTSPKFLDIPRPTPFADIKTLWQHLLVESQCQNQMIRLLAKRNMIMTLFIYGSGLKVSELAQLKKDQIFLSQKKGQASRVMISPPRRDPFTIPLPEVFIPVYEDYRQELEKEKKHSHIEFQQVLFNANPYQILSGGLSPRGVEIVFEDIRNKLSIHLTPKSLRQACIFKWLKQDKKDALIKEWMGVAPNYSLKLYKEHLSAYPHDDNFLKELYKNYL